MHSSVGDLIGFHCSPAQQPEDSDCNLFYSRAAQRGVRIHYVDQTFMQLFLNAPKTFHHKVTRLKIQRPPKLDGEGSAAEIDGIDCKKEAN